MDEGEGMPAHGEPDETEAPAAAEPTNEARQNLLAADDRPSATAPSDTEPPDRSSSPTPERASDPAAAPLGESKPPAEVGPQSASATEISVASNAAAEGRAAAESAIPSTADQQEATGGSENLAAMSDDTPHPAAEEQRPYVAVVDRFIEADLGRLPRAEADRAKHDFDRLTPAAIPSLVYGLNKSAKIHASCPVVVLTFKLDMALRKNSDPELLQYALDHLGDDVPDTAPHAKRLRALLEQWRNMDASGSMEPDRAETTLKQRRSRTR